MVSRNENQPKEFYTKDNPTLKYRSSSNFKQTRASSNCKQSRRSPSPWTKQLLPKERKFELTTRFGFSNDQIIKYEKLIEIMRRLSEEEKSKIVSEILQKSSSRS